MSEIINFELNNWFSGRDYPPEEPFYTWLGNDFKQSFRSEEWVKENKLVVVCGTLDMSMNYCISAPREWVEENCPNLLTDKEYEYRTRTLYKGEETIHTHKGKYSDFIRKPEEDEDYIEGRFGMPFMEYSEENIGVHWVNEEFEEDEDDDYERYYEFNEESEMNEND